MGRAVGIIYGNVSSTGFDIAVSDSSLKRLDYVEVESEGANCLGQVEAIERRSDLSLEQAMEGIADLGPDRVTGQVRLIGFRDGGGRIQVPRVPFRAGTPVHLADESLVTSVLGLQAAADEGAFLGYVKGSKTPVALQMETLAQKHLSVLAKTGAGKSYTVGVILEEFLKAAVPLVVLDPHGEYGALRDPNEDPRELEALHRLRIRPRGFKDQVIEYALDTTLNPQARKLVLEGANLDGREIVEMLGGKLSGGQVGVLYQAIKELKEAGKPYLLKHVIEAVTLNKAPSKWNVINALEVLETTRIFDLRGTPVKELVAPGQCTIINLKGAAPDVQEIVVTRICNMLWDARKRNEVPAHIVVVEEAHNFCPERNVGNAVSGPIIRTVASEGRKFGMGLVIVSQRPAKIDKNVLSQCNTQVVLKVTNPNDLKAIVQSVENISTDIADEVQRLPVGDALVAGGGLTQPIFISVRPRMSSHGGRSVSVLHQDEEGEEGDEEDDKLADPILAMPVPTAPVVVPMPAPATPSGHGSSPADQFLKFEAPVAIATPVVATPIAIPRGEPRVPRHWTRPEQEAIHRVAARVGQVAPSQNPPRTVEILSELWRRQNVDAEGRLRVYLEVAEVACHPTDPHCARCPLQDSCQDRLRRVEERRKRPWLS